MSADHDLLPVASGRTPILRKQRRLVAVGMRPERVIALILAGVLAIAVLSFDISGIVDLHKHPVTGVDYVPVVQYVAARRNPGQQVLVALPPPAYLAFGSTDNLIFLSSPLVRKRAIRYTRLADDGSYVDYWTGVKSIVNTAGLCRLIDSDPDLLILVDQPRLVADWAYQGSMATVIEGLTYVRYSVAGGAMVRGVSPSPSRSPRAEQICAQALTGNLDESDTTTTTSGDQSSNSDAVDAVATTSP